MKLPAGSGVLLQDVKAICQGSSCTTAGKVSTGNQVGGGIITENSDGVRSVWSSAFICHPLRNQRSLNATKEMQTQVMVTVNITSWQFFSYYQVDAALRVADCTAF